MEDRPTGNSEQDPVTTAEGRVDAAENEDDPVRLEALSQLHDILESELDRPEETRLEFTADEDTTSGQE